MHKNQIPNEKGEIWIPIEIKRLPDLEDHNAYISALFGLAEKAPYPVAI